MVPPHTPTPALIVRTTVSIPDDSKSLAQSILAINSDAKPYCIEASARQTGSNRNLKWSRRSFEQKFLSTGGYYRRWGEMSVRMNYWHSYFNYFPLQNLPQPTEIFAPLPSVQFCNFLQQHLKCFRFIQHSVCYKMPFYIGLNMQESKVSNYVVKKKKPFRLLLVLQR